MHLRKAIRKYFALMMMSITLASLSQISFIESAFVSVLDAGDSVEAAGPRAAEVFNPDKVDFQMIAADENIYAYSGGRHVKVFDIKIEAKTEDIELDDLKFTVDGVDSMAIEAAFISDQDAQMLYHATKHDQKLKFANMDVAVKKGEQRDLELLLNVSPEIKRGTSFKLVVERENDALVHGQSGDYSFAQIFPVNGPFITVVRNRF